MTQLSWINGQQAAVGAIDAASSLVVRGISPDMLQRSCHCSVSLLAIVNIHMGHYHQLPGMICFAFFPHECCDSTAG